MQPFEHNTQRAAGDAVVGLVLAVVSPVAGLGALAYAFLALQGDGLYRLALAPELALIAACLAAVSGCVLAAALVLRTPGRRIAFGAWTASVGLLVAALGATSAGLQVATCVSVCVVARRALG